MIEFLMFYYEFNVIIAVLGDLYESDAWNVLFGLFNHGGKFNLIIIIITLTYFT